MIPFKPEPIDALKARFKEALLSVYTAKKVIENPAERPGQKKEHVFDFEDGIRLIVSRDIVKSEEVIHFSGSIDKRFYRGRVDKTLLPKMVDKFYLLLGQRPEVIFAGMSPVAGIPHWYINTVSLN